MLSLAVVPDELCGEWSLQRRLHDRGSGQFGRAVGRLTITADDEGTTWTEQGRLTLGEYGGDFTRTLHSRRIDGEWWMTFADGRPFHPWRPGSAIEHPCRADVYRGGVTVIGPDRFRTWWDVTGPAKSQRILTRLSRADDGAG